MGKMPSEVSVPSRKSRVAERPRGGVQLREWDTCDVAAPVTEPAADDLRHEEEITLTTFQQRSWWARLTERAAFVMRCYKVAR